MKTNHMPLRYKVCAIKSPLDLEIERYERHIEAIQKSISDAEQSFLSRTANEYLSYDQSLVAQYRAVLDTTITSLPSTDLRTGNTDGLMLKLLRINAVLQNLQTLISYINEHDSETNVLDSLQLAPEERTWYQTLLSVFWSSNRHDYYKLRNKHLSTLAEQLQTILAKSISGSINHNQHFELYQTQSCSLHANSTRMFWYKINEGYHKFLELLKIAKVRDRVDFEIDRPEGIIYASITVRAGQLQAKDLENIYCPDGSSSFTLIELLKNNKNKILDSQQNVLIDPFDDAVVQNMLTPLLTNHGFNPSEVIEAIKNCFLVSINITQQENLAMAFNNTGRQMVKQHPEHPYQYFHHLFEQLKTIPTRRSFTPTTVTPALLMDTMHTVNETKATQLITRFGKIGRNSFMTVTANPTEGEKRPNLRWYSLERQRKCFINSDLSSRIFDTLTEENLLDSNGFPVNDIVSNRKKLKSVLSNIHILDSANTLSRKQRRAILRTLKIASETKFSPNATIQMAKLVPNEHGLSNHFTVFLIEDGENKWLLFPYDHLGDAAYNLFKVPSKTDFQQFLKKLDSKMSLPKGIYYTFFQNQLQIINKGENIHDLSVLYRKMSSHPYFLRFLLLLTLSGVLLPNSPIGNLLDQSVEFGKFFTIYCYLKTSRMLSAGDMLIPLIKYSGSKASKLFLSLSFATGALYLIMYVARNFNVNPDLFKAFVFANLFLSAAKWSVKLENIQKSWPTYPSYIFYMYLATMLIILGSIFVPDFVMTNDVTATLALALDALRASSLLRRDLTKNNKALEVRVSHELKISTALISIGLHLGSTWLLLKGLDYLLDYINSASYMLSN